MRALTSLLLYPVAALALAWSAPARANGRFPDAQTMVHAPSDPSALWVRTTFGVLVSRDGGAHWRWMCERSLGFEGTWDPPLAVTGEGRLLVGNESGLVAVDPAGCTTAPVASGPRWVVSDLTTDARGERVVGITSSASEPPGVFFWQATGAEPPSFVPLPGVAPGALKLESVEVAPSAPARFWITAVPVGAGPRAHLFGGERTARGATIVELHPKLPFDDARLFVAAVDPKDPARVLLRALRPDGSDVLLSTDGGKSFRSVLHVAGSLFGFAKGDDGATYFAGSGDPREGVFRSKDRGATWTSTARVRTYCLHAAGKRLYACASPLGKNGTFAVGVSDDEGATFTPALARFGDVEGPVCESACGAAWPQVKAVIAPVATPPPTPPSGGGDASARATTSPTTSTAPSRRSCSCEMPLGAESSRGIWDVYAFCVIVAGSQLLHRRTRGRPRPERPRAPCLHRRPHADLGKRIAALRARLGASRWSAPCTGSPHDQPPSHRSSASSRRLDCRVRDRDQRVR